MPSGKVVIIGAGPAGMACVYALAKAKQPSLVIEQDDAPGGLCRTLNFCGYFFDIGGHRFLSKSQEVNRLWQEIMGDDMLHVKRLSRIYYRKRYFNYPLSFLNTIFNLGLLESLLCIGSYLKHKYFKRGKDNTFEEWIINRFGKRLYDIFFKTYTEKVWAVPCQDISADWARQRIRGLSLRVAIQKAILGLKKQAPKTLCDKFMYPKTGPGEFYQRLKEHACCLGAEFEFGKTVVSIRHNAERIISLQVNRAQGGQAETLPVDILCSSMPLPVFINLLEPKPAGYILAAARKLLFRDFLVVNIILDKESVFPDQWVYIHSPEVKVGRIQNYKNWSPAMVVDPKKTSLGLEYFCNEGNNLWNMNDIDLINYAVKELEEIGIVSRRYLIDGFVVRRKNVYPVYSLDYQESVGIIRDYLSRISNFYPMGRSGLFRYNNSDHALLTGIYTAGNLLGKSSYDVWNINSDSGYLE